jgi:hypothetical protein
MVTTYFDIGVATVFVTVTATLVSLFRRKLKSDSTRRLFRMMARIGVYPTRFSRLHDDTDLDMQAVRRRCRMCPAEDLCERWLAGEIDGDNGFCPNAAVFHGVLKTR